MLVLNWLTNTGVSFKLATTAKWWPATCVGKMRSPVIHLNGASSSTQSSCIGQSSICRRTFLVDYFVIWMLYFCCLPCDHGDKWEHSCTLIVTFLNPVWEYNKQLWSVLAFDPFKPLNAFMFYSKWTGWIVCHCTWCLNNTPPPTHLHALLLDRAAFSLNHQ